MTLRHTLKRRITLSLKNSLNRIFKLYDKYEALLVANGRRNGEVDVAIRIFKDSYASYLLGRSFIEDQWDT